MVETLECVCGLAHAGSASMADFFHHAQWPAQGTNAFPQWSIHDAYGLLKDAQMMANC